MMQFNLRFLPQFEAPCPTEEHLHGHSDAPLFVHSCDSGCHTVKIQSCYMVKVDLETGIPTEALAGRVQIVAHHNGHKSGIVGNPVH